LQNVKIKKYLKS